MTYYLQSESSAALISSPSRETATALEDFRKEHPDESRYYGCLLGRFVPFLTDEIDIQVDPNFLPDSEQNESLNEEIVRHSIIVRLLNEFWDVHWDIDLNAVSVSDIVEYGFIVKVLYWHLNR